jgi:endonuclease/exonuclease/phosphatase family metal-dependent hydrolase
VTASTCSIVSWNCFGAAQNPVAFFRWKGAPNAHRFRHPWLRSALADEDIVCVQELFLGDAEELFEALPLAHKVRDHNRTAWWPLTIGGSGLGVASRLPILETSMRAFSRPHVGTERFARKGMLHARVQLGEAELDVVTTHLQSGVGEGPRRVRRRHLTELRARVDELNEHGKAVVLCGDFNIDGRGPVRGAEYADLAKTLADFDDLGAQGDRTTYHPHPTLNALAHRYDAGAPEQRLDYVFFRGAKRGPKVEVLDVDRIFDRALEAHGGFAETHASDHFGLRVKLGVA